MLGGEVRSCSSGRRWWWRRSVCGSVKHAWYVVCMSEARRTCLTVLALEELVPNTSRLRDSQDKKKVSQTHWESRLMGDLEVVWVCVGGVGEGRLVCHWEDRRLRKKWFHPMFDWHVMRLSVCG